MATFPVPLKSRESYCSGQMYDEVLPPVLVGRIDPGKYLSSVLRFQAHTKTVNGGARGIFTAVYILATMGLVVAGSTTAVWLFPYNFIFLGAGLLGMCVGIAVMAVYSARRSAVFKAVVAEENAKYLGEGFQFLETNGTALSIIVLNAGPAGGIAQFIPYVPGSVVETYVPIKPTPGGYGAERQPLASDLSDLVEKGKGTGFARV